MLPLLSPVSPGDDKFGFLSAETPLSMLVGALGMGMRTARPMSTLIGVSRCLLSGGW